jgi:hypothetical protein
LNSATSLVPKIIGLKTRATLEEDLQAINCEIDAAAASTRQEEDGHISRIKCWSEARLGSDVEGQSSQLPPGLLECGICAVPVSHNGFFQVELIRVPIPIEKLLDKVMLNAPASFTRVVDDVFSQMHEALLDTSAPVVEPLKEVLALCYFAKMCVCHMPILVGFVLNLIKEIRPLFQPKTTLRKLLDQNLIVLYIRDQSSAATAIDYFVHLSYENLVTWHAQVMILDRVDPIHPGEAAGTKAFSSLTRIRLKPRNEERVGLGTWYQTFANGDLSNPRDLQVLQLTTVDVSVTTFRPSDIVVFPAPGFEDRRQSLGFWKGKAHQRKRKMKNPWAPAKRHAIQDGVRPHHGHDERSIHVLPVADQEVDELAAGDSVDDPDDEIHGGGPPDIDDEAEAEGLEQIFEDEWDHIELSLAEEDDVNVNPAEVPGDVLPPAPEDVDAAIEVPLLCLLSTYVLFDVLLLRL